MVRPYEWPLQVVTTCRARDLPVLEITLRKLSETVPLKSLHVIVPDQDCVITRRTLGGNVQVVPENTFIPGMTIQALRDLPLKGFPKAAGWYFQQFLKLQFAFMDEEDDYYLIWDADTVPLRPMRFFDESGRMLLTKADEFHSPYFGTYRRILGEEPNREFSFIAQHILVQKSVAREMLAQIEAHVSGEGNWAWKILKMLPAEGVNLFSEYETYGHFLKNHYPERVRFIERSWLREGVLETGGDVPNQATLTRMAAKFDFVAFERAEKRRWRRIACRVKLRLNQLLGRA